MKTNLYYRAVFRRQSMLNEFVMDFFLYFCSYPRLMLEVFVRKNFGERYFSFFSALMIGYFGEVDHLIPWQIDHLINWRPVVENASRSDSKLVNKSYNYS
ncbi:hypothetical protein DYBT9275_04891 [Dyadobacter sp. CECT 9275]|uniref:Uncharacterized protein n=1 Tax=Dyadobacter helix TaxID=2822344 RepID=A0A916NDJ1_9BACT|nr:hypothetical protein DYBT9275_04891 [Dyadobacter sp. CECT 9275]